MPDDDALDFDTERFVSFLEHFSNSNGNEAGNAIRKALKQCADADLNFVDALKQTFGGGADTDGELDRLRDEIRDYADNLEEAAKVIAAQKVDIDRLQAAGGGVHHGDTLRGYWRGKWQHPNFRLALLVGCAVGLSYTDNALLRVGACLLFLLWSMAVYRVYGGKQLVMKWAIVCCAVLRPELMHFHGYFDAEVYHWRVVFHLFPLQAVGAALLVASKLTVWVAEKFCAVIWENGTVRMVRGWF